YADKANNAQGFNQLQRGSSPGGNIGDFGLIGVVQGRLTKKLSIEANLGGSINSNPRSDAFGGGDVALLDRGNDFYAGLGFDYTVSKRFQWIAELKSVEYWGGRTPNAFPNNPVDVLFGLRAYPRRWWGVSAWYRAHM